MVTTPQSPPLVPRLGVSTGLLPRLAQDFTPRLLSRLANSDITVLTTHLGPTVEDVVGQPARRLSAMLDDAGIRVGQATGYNPRLIESSPVAWQVERCRLLRALDAAVDLNSEMVITGVGSHSPRGHYAPHRDNHSRATVETLIANLRDVAPEAEARGMPIAIECHVLTTMGDVATIAEVLEGVGSDHVRANFDPVNLLGDRASVYASTWRIRSMWDRLGPFYVPTVHVKDVRIADRLTLCIEECAPGEGLLDHREVLGVARRMSDTTAMIVEHLPPRIAWRAVRWLQELLTADGVAWQRNRSASSRRRRSRSRSSAEKLVSTEGPA